MGLEIFTAKIESHADEVKKAMNDQLNATLEAIGLDAASTAANKAPVDTGRLKASISHQVVESEGAVYIGTNVEYAVFQELGTSRGVPGKHFLQFGATAHSDQYRQMIEEALKQE